MWTMLPDVVVGRCQGTNTDYRIKEGGVKEDVGYRDAPHTKQGILQHKDMVVIYSIY